MKETTPAERQAIIDVIREEIVAKRMVTNQEIAEAIQNRLGIAVTASYVCSMRNTNGFGVLQLFRHEQLEKAREKEQARSNQYDRLFSPITETLEPETIDQQLQDLALVLTVNCVRNTVLEDYHRGKFPTSHADHDSDIHVVGPENALPWSETTRLTQAEMKAFNIQVSNRIYTVLQYLLNPAYADKRKALVQFLNHNYPFNWNKPEMDSDLEPNEESKQPDWLR